MATMNRNEPETGPQRPAPQSQRPSDSPVTPIPAKDLPMPPLGVQPQPSAPQGAGTRVPSGLGDLARNPSLHFTDVGFSGFNPRDDTSSLFRKWQGQFQGARSDGENFSVEVTFIQTDTPHVTGPMVQQALERLMEYGGCNCLPSKKVDCERHAVLEE